MSFTAVKVEPPLSLIAGRSGPMRKRDALATAACSFGLLAAPEALGIGAIDLGALIAGDAGFSDPADWDRAIALLKEAP